MEGLGTSMQCMSALLQERMLLPSWEQEPNVPAVLARTSSRCP